MKTLIFLFATILAAPCLAWTPVNANDTGSLNDDGLQRWVNRGTLFQGYTFSSRTTFFGRESKFFIHFLRPDEDMETLMIGDLRFNEFLAPCADEDTLSARFEMARSFRTDGVDSLRDWDSEPRWVSPIIHIPYTGYTTRFFFSSLSRPQDNLWDEMVVQINNEFDAGDPIILRFVPLGESGFLINGENQPFCMAYTTDLSQEVQFLDIGDSRICYLSPTEASTYHGLVIRGIASRDPWTGQRAMLRLFSPSSLDVPLAVKETALPWPEQHTRIIVQFGLTPDFLMEYPTLNLSANGQETATCRMDSLTARYQP